MGRGDDSMKTKLYLPYTGFTINEKSDEETTKEEYDKWITLLAKEGGL